MQDPEQEHGLDLEHQEQDGKQVVTHVELHPSLTTCRDTTLIRLHLLRIVGARRYRVGNHDNESHKDEGRQHDGD